MKSLGQAALIFVTSALVVILVFMMISLLPWIKSRVFFWLLASVMLATLIVGIVTMKKLFLNSPRDLVPSRLLLRLMIWLGGLAVLIGLDGVQYEVLRLCETTVSYPGLPFIEYNPFTEYANEYIGAAMTHLNIGFGSALIALLIWFAGTGRLARLEYHEDLIRRIINA